jgi:hypothetical protein
MIWAPDDNGAAAAVIAIWTKIQDAWPFRARVQRRSFAIVTASDQEATDGGRRAGR